MDAVFGDILQMGDKTASKQNFTLANTSANTNTNTSAKTNSNANTTPSGKKIYKDTSNSGTKQALLTPTQNAVQGTG